MENRRTIRSYVLRQGRLTPGQQNALEQYWSLYGVDFSATPLVLDTLFGRTAPVTLEIGFGDGASLLQQAMQHPERNFIGIEVHRPGVGRLLSRCHEAGLSNLRVINHDAVEVLNQQIADNSLNCVQLFFPDPWHKKRHHKRRLLQPAFAELILRKLSPGGQFHMATDWQPYAEHMLEVMEAASGFRNISGKFHYTHNQGRRPPTKFEQRGQRLGHGVYDLVYEKV
ncbi:MAG: tRNA (guanosine(46)-N7)-methyltransferase TrmB [Gammaproteobacteria bacterium]